LHKNIPISKILLEHSINTDHLWQFLHSTAALGSYNETVRLKTPKYLTAYKKLSASPLASVGTQASTVSDVAKGGGRAGPGGG
jgi:hypothetical protein